ncbi:hypothetical protein TTHERM_001100558 (macronuclear) [Tetrahymena thermophila SB210]|uniref:Uncharacterized protein n=1 Tax=Tetrahymena thermophila (strain SB210) TaxID=312017 RepID=W7XGR2_TETTS|nr:hypothetical protein TTHERM_001100558 [Tetrahymena thermophila SB210]EWS72154.1 hypothetical protein TTHERM_001100558 [Tetrahymena thermophila SB210]|eukprot:XP_012655316.1 hypothetical protein TTHERM_001100558 [Tetrahymena thermophila SB210]
MKQNDYNKTPQFSLDTTFNEQQTELKKLNPSSSQNNNRNNNPNNPKLKRKQQISYSQNEEFEQIQKNIKIQQYKSFNSMKQNDQNKTPQFSLDTNFNEQQIELKKLNPSSSQNNSNNNPNNPKLKRKQQISYSQNEEFEQIEKQTKIEEEYESFNSNMNQNYCNKTPQFNMDSTIKEQQIMLKKINSSSYQNCNNSLSNPKLKRKQQITYSQNEELEQIQKKTKTEEQKEFFNSMKQNIYQSSQLYTFEGYSKSFDLDIISPKQDEPKYTIINYIMNIKQFDINGDNKFAQSICQKKIIPHYIMTDKGILQFNSSDFYNVSRFENYEK